MDKRHPHSFSMWYRRYHLKCVSMFLFCITLDIFYQIKNDMFRYFPSLQSCYFKRLSILRKAPMLRGGWQFQILVLVTNTIRWQALKLELKCYQFSWMEQKFCVTFKLCNCHCSLLNSRVVTVNEIQKGPHCSQSTLLSSRRKFQERVCKHWSLLMFYFNLHLDYPLMIKQRQ